MKELIGKARMRQKNVTGCPVCGSAGNQIYSGLVDRLFSASGVWGSKQCTNNQCNLLWLDPAPITVDLHLAYENYYTHADSLQAGNERYSARFAWQGYRSLVFGSKRFPASIKQKLMGACFFLLPNRKPAVEYPIRQFHDMPAGKVLEIGCGAGQMLCEIKEMGWQVIGIDFDPAAVTAAQNKGLDVRVGDLQVQAFADASFDVVLMNHVIEHLPAPIDTLREIRRLLRPGGRLIGITPNAESWGHKHFKSDWRGLEPPRHLQIFTQRALWCTANRAGFEQIEVNASVMTAIQILKESMQLRSPRKRINSISARIYLEAIWLWEWVLTLMGKRAGEILLFVVEKTK